MQFVPKLCYSGCNLGATSARCPNGRTQRKQTRKTSFVSGYGARRQKKKTRLLYLEWCVRVFIYSRQNNLQKMTNRARKLVLRCNARREIKIVACCTFEYCWQLFLCTQRSSALKTSFRLPGEMGEGFIRFSHLMYILPFLNCLPFIL